MSSRACPKLQCDLCERWRREENIVKCQDHHIVCLKCLKQVNKGKLRCPLAECNCKLSVKCRSYEYGDTPKKMFGNYLKITRSISSTSLASKCSTIYHPHTLAALANSKRPVKCPYHNCNKTVAVAALDSHFIHEHRHVAHANIVYEDRQCLEFYLSRLPIAQVLCLQWSHVYHNNDYLDDENLTQPRPVLIVMAYRFPYGAELVATSATSTTISHHTITSSSSTTISPSHHSVLSTTSTTPSLRRPNNNNNTSPTPSRHHHEELPAAAVVSSGGGRRHRRRHLPRMDKVMIWLATNVATSHTYTVALNTPCETWRMKYYGPLGTVHESPSVLFQQGLGLVISDVVLEKLTQCSGGTGCLGLNYLVHYRGVEFVDFDVA